VSGAPTRRITRRSFLTRSAVGIGGALVVGIEILPGVGWADAAAAAVTAGGSVGVYVTIGTDGSVTLVCPGSEMGQGISTALPMILAEELMVDWSMVKLQLADADARLNRPVRDTTSGVWSPGTSQSTGGSTSVRGYHDYLRTVGATVRQQMIWAAAEPEFAGVAVAQLRAVDGTVRHDATGRSWTYGELATKAVTMNPTDVAWVQPPYRIIGTRAKRLDVPAKVDGSAVFGIDVDRPNMKYASVVLAPKVGQTVGSVTAPTGVTTVRLTDSTGAAVGVAAITTRSTWDAMNAAKKLTVTWVDAAYTASIDTAAMKTRATGLLASGTPVVVVDNGNADAALAAAPAARRWSRTYSAPYLAHMTMEPMNATALVTSTSCEIWAPTQTPTRAVQEAAAVTGLPASAITLHTTFLGGGFGRRLSNDYVRYAVQVARAVPGTPVKTVWSREQDLTHDIYRPASLARIDAAVDTGGALTAFKARIVCGHSQTSSLEGFAVRDILYTYPSNWRVEFVQDTIPVPLGYWRSVGHSQNTFFIESFLDEVAAGTGQDPIALRRALLASGSDQQNRALAVLDRLVTESGWNTPPPAGRSRGVALGMGFGDTIVGQVAEVSGSASNFRVWKVTVVVDPGRIVNPDTVAAQMESAVIEGLGAAMFGQMTFSAGKPVQTNFDKYRMLKLAEAPAIRTVIIESGAAMGGVGEPGLPPIAPAVANAIAKLTGTRLRSMPFLAGSSGGNGGSGPAPAVSALSPASGRVGAVVTITGTGLTGASRVTFNNTAATTFSVVSATRVTATVPAGATTGKVAVTTPTGTATSAATFTVLP